MSASAAFHLGTKRTSLTYTMYVDACNLSYFVGFDFIEFTDNTVKTFD